MAAPPCPVCCANTRWAAAMAVAAAPAFNSLRLLGSINRPFSGWLAAYQLDRQRLAGRTRQNDSEKYRPGRPPSQLSGRKLLAELLCELSVPRSTGTGEHRSHAISHHADDGNVVFGKWFGQRVQRQRADGFSVRHEGHAQTESQRLRPAKAGGPP